MVHLSVVVGRAALKPNARLVVSELPLARARPKLPPPTQPSSIPGCRDFSYAACSAGERITATSAMGIVCVPDVVLTATSESFVITAPETTCLSVRVTTMGCSEENCATASQSIVTVPACSVFIVSFLSLTFRIVPVRRSPFLRVTCSADNVMQQQQSMTAKTLVLNILVSSLLCCWCSRR